MDISVSNMTTEAHSVEDISISNSLAYDATELLVGFFNYTTFAGNEGYEIDNLSVTIFSYEPPIELSEYQSWLNENSLVDGSADSDNDGMIDFLEYALGKIQVLRIMMIYPECIMEILSSSLILKG